MRTSTPVAITCVLAVGALAAGCSAIPKAAAMRVQDVPTGSRHAESIGVLVAGGQEFDFRISDEQFGQALRESLADSGIFARVVEADAGDVRLDVVLGDGQGMEGRELTLLWNLSRVATRETIWQELVTSHGRSHHFVGVIRGRRSLEMAAQENIRLGLEKLSRVDLDGE